MTATPSPAVIGGNVKKLRQRHKLSLDELANRSGVSKGMLSQIESGKVNPTVATLWKIARAFRVDFNVLLKGKGETVRKFIACRREDLTPLDTESSGVSIRVLSPVTQADELELYLLDLKPGAKLGSEPHAPGSEEFLTVLAGEVRVTAGNRAATLHAGDVLIYQCDVEHEIANASPDAPAGVHLVVRFPVQPSPA